MKKFWSAALGLLLLAACGQEKNTFLGKEYKLINAPENAEITLGFVPEGGKFFGKAAINRYFGSYTVDGNNFSFGPAASTMMAGPEELMKAESEYLRFLPEIKTYKLNGKMLTFSNGKDKELVFEETAVQRPQ